MAYKKKTHTETAPIPPDPIDPGKMTVSARIMESGEFDLQMAKYARDIGNIPAMLAGILKELVAIRLLMEEEQ